MVRFEFSMKKGQVLGVYDGLDSVEHKFELRYGAYQQEVDGH